MLKDREDYKRLKKKARFKEVKEKYVVVNVLAFDIGYGNSLGFEGKR